MKRVQQPEWRFMRKSGRRIGIIALALLLSVICAGAFQPNCAMAASDDEAILEGVYMGEMSLAGMTAEEAKASVSAFVEELKQKKYYIWRRRRSLCVRDCR